MVFITDGRQTIAINGLFMDKNDVFGGKQVWVINDSNVCFGDLPLLMGDGLPVYDLHDQAWTPVYLTGDWITCPNPDKPVRVNVI